MTQHDYHEKEQGRQGEETAGAALPERKKAAPAEQNRPEIEN